MSRALASSAGGMAAAPGEMQLDANDVVALAWTHTLELETPEVANLDPEVLGRVDAEAAVEAVLLEAVNRPGAFVDEVVPEGFGQGEVEQRTYRSRHMNEVAQARDGAADVLDEALLQPNLVSDAE